MLFNSIDFLLIFLPCTLLLYYVLGKVEGPYARIWLCVASIVFYGWLNPGLVIILAVSVLFNFGISLLITSQKERRQQNLFLTVGVVGNLGALFYYKYAHWVLTVLADLGLHAGPLGQIVLPLGISFFTFTQIGYLLDCRDGLAKNRTFVDYVLFVTFFPHLIAGPILHHRDVMPQLTNPAIYRFSHKNFSIGLMIFFAGMFKKTVIADNISMIADAGFQSAGTAGFGASWISVLAYALQLYFDFSGYSDMAIGLAIMFNIRFPLNFNSPYKARNIVEFWQRWHMTLTSYLNAYLYNPISIRLSRAVMERRPNEKNPLATWYGFLLTIAVPTIWTMVLAGVWHGAGGKYLIFGALHATYIVVYRRWSPYGTKRRKKLVSPMARAADLWSARIITLICVAVADIFFRADSISQALSLLAGMVGLHPGDLAFQLQGTGVLWHAWLELLVLIGLFAVVWTAPNIYQMLGESSPAIGKVEAVKDGLLRWQPTLFWAAATGVVGATAVIAIGGASPFLYFQF